MEDGQGLQSRRQLRPAESPPTPVCARSPPNPGYLQLHLVSQSEPDEGLRGIRDILTLQDQHVPRDWLEVQVESYLFILMRLSTKGALNCTTAARLHSAFSSY